MLKAIIFDVDGTLAETEEIHRAAFNNAFADADLAWHWSETLYGELLKVTGGKERLANFIDAIGGVGMGVARVDRLIADLHQRKTAIYAEMIGSGSVRLRPGVAELIESARGESIRLAIATTTSLPNVEALLRSTLGADGIAAFEIIAAGDCVPLKKPAPDIFITVLDQLGLDARDCVAIEDSENGLRSAMNAGLPVLITPSHYTRTENFAGAALVADALPELDAVRQLHRDAVSGAAFNRFMSISQ